MAAKAPPPSLFLQSQLPVKPPSALPRHSIWPFYSSSDLVAGYLRYVPLLQCFSNFSQLGFLSILKYLF